MPESLWGSFSPKKLHNKQNNVKQWITINAAKITIGFILFYVFYFIPKWRITPRRIIETIKKSINIIWYFPWFKASPVPTIIKISKTYSKILHINIDDNTNPIKVFY